MQKYQRFLFLIPLLLIIVGCNNFGDPLISVKGSIKNNQSQPINGVSVIIKKRENGEVVNARTEQITKDDGVFDFTFIGNVPKDCFIVVKKDGFKPFEKDLELETDKPNIVEIVLESAVN